MTAALPGQEGLPPVETYDGDGPVLGSQAADNAAWDAVRAAVLAGDEVDPVAADEVTARVVPVLARLVDSARPVVDADGPVLGEDARKRLFDALGTISAIPKYGAHRAAIAETLAPVVAALLIQARAAGAAEERERAQGEIAELRRTIRNLNPGTPCECPACHYADEDPS